MRVFEYEYDVPRKRWPLTPCVVIPTFWTRPGASAPGNLLTVYDHPTPVDSDGTLPQCLESLSKVQGLDQVLIIVAAADSSIEHQAEDRVRTSSTDFPAIDALIFGPAELGSLHRRLEQIEFADMIHRHEPCGLRCGSQRRPDRRRRPRLRISRLRRRRSDHHRQGLPAACPGRSRHEDPRGQGRACQVRLLHRRRGTYQRYSQPHASDVFWRKGDAFNDALAIVDAPPRIKPSSVAFGGCLALHRHMYTNVSFDPWVVRGEDMDYVINARMHGGDVFIDGEWSVIHKPPHLDDDTLQFRQDMYRFVYEHRKIEFAKSQVDLRQVSSESLMPYPGSFIGPSFTRRAWMTAMMRGVARKESKYFQIARSTIKDAQGYAR